MMVAEVVCAAATSKIATTWICSRPKPNAYRGKLRASADSNAVCLATSKGMTPLPVTCAHHRGGVL